MRQKEFEHVVRIFFLRNCLYFVLFIHVVFLFFRSHSECMMIFPIVCTFQIYGCITSSPKIIKAQEWSQKSIVTLRNQIKMSYAVYFQATKKIDDTKFSGILTFESDASQSLIIAKEAKRKSIAFSSYIIE